MALRRMVLRDFVIVHELELELHAGYTALTGETGAGKSILIDALQLVTGALAWQGADVVIDHPSQVRGATRALVPAHQARNHAATPSVTVPERAAPEQ
jgi:DNA repair protein RecN (Recombination protein N)